MTTCKYVLDNFDRPQYEDGTFVDSLYYRCPDGQVKIDLKFFWDQIKNENSTWESIFILIFNRTKTAINVQTFSINILDCILRWRNQNYIHIVGENYIHITDG